MPDHAAVWYLLVSPSRIGLRRIWWLVRLITCGGVWAWARPDNGVGRRTSEGRLVEDVPGIWAPCVGAVLSV